MQAWTNCGIILKMEENSYQIQIQLIEQKINEHAYEEALALVLEELSMPYIPKLYHERFLSLHEQLKQAMQSTNTTQTFYDDEALLGLLTKDEHAQLKALDQLSRMNLRNKSELIQLFFDRLNDPIFLRLLIRILIEQQLHDEFTFKDEGVEYQIIPASLALPEDGDGYQAAEQLIKLWCEKNPSMERLCMDRLVYMGLAQLPLVYTEDEGDDLAYAILEDVASKLLNPEDWEQLKSQLFTGDNGLSTH